MSITSASFHNFHAAANINMSGHDLDLVAVRSFICELSLDEIIQYDPGAGFLDKWGYILDSDHEMTAESSIAGATSDESSDCEDLQPATEIKEYPTKKPKKPKTEHQRKLQQVYDKKSRNNKRARHHAMSGSFVPELKKFVGLMNYRILRTENELHQLCLAKKRGAYISAKATVQRQLELNYGALECIQSTAEDWRKRKSGESGRCFLKKLSIDIQHLVEKLQALGVQLGVATNELRWRLEDKTIGVWV